MNIILPMHRRGPSPNGMNVHGSISCFRSSLKRSGSNLSGFGKYFGSI